MEDGWCWTCVAEATEDVAAFADTSTATLPDEEQPPATGGTTWREEREGERGGGGERERRKREGERERERGRENENTIEGEEKVTSLIIN